MPGMLARMSALARNFSSAAMIVSTKSAIRASLQFGQVCNSGKVAFDLAQTSFYLPGQQAVGCGRRSCFGSCSIFDQRLPRRCQLLDNVKGLTRCRIRLQL
jgi:hypothetical protein